MLNSIGNSTLTAVTMLDSIGKSTLTADKYWLLQEIAL